MFLAFLLLLSSCKKDSVDGSSVKDFQTSINDMTTSLSTLEQTKFNEALYVLKTFAVEGNTDVQKLEALAKLLNSKKVPEIFALADEIAKKNDLDWTSVGPPSLGEMNIFQSIEATEVDPNDINASALSITVQPLEKDSLVGAKALRIIPKLVDNVGEPIEFSNAGLETVMEVYSNGEKLSTAKNLMSNNDFKGFYLKLASLPSDKVVDSKIDVKISVKTTKKTYQLLKAGIPVSDKILKPKEEEKKEEETKKEEQSSTPETSTDNKQQENTHTTSTPSTPVEKPEVAVGKFLNNIGSRNLKDAYNMSENPNWGSYDKFSNPNFGFGAIKNLTVKSISTKSSSDKNAVVNAVYQVVDKDGNTTTLNASCGLKLTENGWKITTYKINSSEKK